MLMVKSIEVFSLHVHVSTGVVEDLGGILGL